MASKELEQRAQSVIDAVKTVKDVAVPLRPFIQIGENLYERGSRDIDYLKKVKYDVTQIELIPVLCGMLRIATANFFDVRFETPQSRTDFLNMRERADDILFECLAYADNVWAKNPGQKSKLSKIREGGSHADIIQDLVEVKTTIESDLAAFEAKGFDKKILDEIPELSSKMANLLAKATMDKSESPELRIARDKVYTALHTVLADLVEDGKLALRSRPNIASLYTMAYTPRKRTQEPVEEAVPA